MSASKKEADHNIHVSSESDQDFAESDAPAPGEGASSMLVATDSYEDLTLHNYEQLNFKKAHRRTGSITAITKKGPVSEGETEKSKTDTGETSTEDDGQSSQDELVNGPDLVNALVRLKSTDVAPDEGTPAPGSPDIIDDEHDVSGPKWRLQKKHIFILSEAGKPIYSRYGNEDKLVTIMGVMQALVSFVQDSKDSIRSIIAGDHKFVFLTRDHLVLVAVSGGSDSTSQLVHQLTYVYNQILSVLTHSQLSRIFKERRNYDLRRLLTGAEKFVDNLLNMMDVDASFMLGAVRCLPLDSGTRDTVAQTIVQYAKTKDLVFAIMIANNQLVTMVRMKKYYLHPMDLHLIINLVNASESFKAAESWTPICLPKFDNSGFLHAHISYLDDSCQVCLLLLTVDRDSFFTLSESKQKIYEKLTKNNCLTSISQSLTRCSYKTQECGISDLRHFLYKSRSTAQYTSPELEAPYLAQTEQDRLLGLYHYLHNRIHSSARPLKILYHVGPYETLLGWVTSAFELYSVFAPLVTKAAAIHAINKLLRWIKREEDQLFILNSVTF